METAAQANGGVEPTRDGQFYSIQNRQIYSIQIKGVMFIIVRLSKDSRELCEPCIHHVAFRGRNFGRGVHDEKFSGR